MTDAEAAAGAGGDGQEPPADPWQSYLAAAQRLDLLRRAAAAATSQQTQAVQAAQGELATVRARLAPQRSRLTDLGVSPAELTPSAAELSGAAAALVGGPLAVLGALRAARTTADAADAALVAATPRVVGRASSPWLRNLLVYVPYAVVVLAVQIGLYLVSPADSLPALALACGLVMPAAAFGLGWLTVGFAFPPAPGAGPVDRTPLVGVVVCFAPIVLTCMGVGLSAVVR